MSDLFAVLVDLTRVFVRLNDISALSERRSRVRRERAIRRCGITPAMKARVADHLWTLEEMIGLIDMFKI